MKKTLLISIFLMGIFQLFGQSLRDSIEIVNFSGTAYYMNGSKLRPRDLEELTLTNEAALNEIITARRNNSVATILGLSGGILLSSHLILTISRRGSNLAGGILGTGLILSSLPFFVLYRKHVSRGVYIYNKDINLKNMNSKEISLGFTSSGIGIQMTF